MNHSHTRHRTPPQCAPTPSSCRKAQGWCLLLLALLLSSCARMGRPDGGWYDETPPYVVGAVPKDGGTQVSARKIRILFNEFIKLENASEKVVVSPPQMEQPDIKTLGKRIDVEIKDSLKPNTTYTVDFSDAISDNNEGNPLGNYTYSFSTGERIDTLQVSGYVLQADNLEPVKGILVGLYADLADSAFTTRPMLRVARADSRGHFVIRGVAPGTYRVYALADMDGNYMLSQRAEQLAFSHDTFTPGTAEAFRQDTTWTDSLHIKGIERVAYTRFTPDDITLRAFTQPLTDRFFLKAERLKATHFTLTFSYGSDSLPTLRGLDFDAAKDLLIEPSARRDTITYWITDTALVNRDTLNVELSYFATDTLGHLQPQTDTLQILSKDTYARRIKKQQKDADEWTKKQEKKKKRGEPYDSIMPRQLTRLDLRTESSLDPDRNISFEFESPVARIDTSLIHLYAKHDTLWYKAPFRLEARPIIAPGDTVSGDTPLSRRRYILRGEWRPDIEYSLEIDSLAFTDIYGLVTPKIKRGFKVRSLDEYGSLMFTIPHFTDTPVVVQLLDAQDAVVKTARLIDGTAQFYYISPGTYYARLFTDDNGNGVWDTGEYAADRQPETVFYYPEEIECKAKWDINLNWQPASRPLYRQKPEAITKQKADQQRRITQRNIERARKLGIEYIKKP